MKQIEELPNYYITENGDVINKYGKYLKTYKDKSCKFNQ